MKFYHISYDDLGEEKLFNPKIPISCCFNEDKITKRICVSDNIKGCLNAIAKKTWLKNNNTSFFVYTCNVTDYISPSDIYIKHNVHDAILNSEYWILKSTVMKREVYEVSKVEIETYQTIRPEQFFDYYYSALNFIELSILSKKNKELITEYFKEYFLKDNTFKMSFLYTQILKDLINLLKNNNILKNIIYNILECNYCYTSLEIQYIKNCDIKKIQ